MSGQRESTPAKAQFSNSDDRGTTRVITDPKEIYDIYLNLALTAKGEVLMAVISDHSIIRTADFWSDIQCLASPNANDDNRLEDENDVHNNNDRAKPPLARFRLLIPITNEANKPFISSTLKGIDWREIEPTGVTFATYDRAKAVLVEYSQPPHSEKVHDAVASAILTSNRQTVIGLASIFDALWRESELAEKEEKSRKQEQKLSRESRLLQDILTHDIRNYNQISSLCTDILKEKFKGDAEALRILATLRSAIDDSTSLVDKAKRLGKVLAAAEETKLYAVNLIDSINRSLAIARKAQAEKEIICTKEDLILSSDSSSLSAMSPTPPQVLADDLVDEVFTNVISNSTRYTDGPQVHLEIKIGEVKEHPKNAQLEPTLQINDAISSGALHSSYWKVSIIDRGRGIPDEMKGQVFARYLAQAKGSGLGMSIVHALVIERYKGRITLRNRVPNDYRQGTTIEIRLPKAG